MPAQPRAARQHTPGAVPLEIQRPPLPDHRGADVAAGDSARRDGAAIPIPIDLGAGELAPVDQGLQGRGGIVAALPRATTALADLRALGRVDSPEADALAGFQFERVAVDHTGRLRARSGRDDEQDQGCKEAEHRPHISATECRRFHSSVDKSDETLAGSRTCVYGSGQYGRVPFVRQQLGRLIMLDVAVTPATKVRSNHGPHERLVRLVSELSLLRTGKIRLAAGGTSTFYFDMKPTLFSPEGAALVAERVLDFAAQDGARFVGGLEIGAVPIVACVAQLSFLGGRQRVQGFFVRKTPKDHGTRKRIEGLAPEALKGNRVLIVDDVTTTGSSVLQAVEAARAEGAIVETVLTVVDRLEGAAANLAKRGVNLVPLTTADDYGI